MKRLSSLVAAALVLAVGLTAQAQVPYYFDVNDDAAGSGVTDQAVYPWNTTGIGWNTINADGTQAMPGLNVAWTNGNDAVFSAGTDAATPGLDPKGTTIAMNIAAGIQSHNTTVEEGVVQVLSGTWDATNQLLVKPGAAIRSAISAPFANGTISADGLTVTKKITLQGTTAANAGEFQARNAGSGGSMITTGAGLKEVEIDGFGRVSYDDGNGTPDNQVSILTSQVITGVGGTPTNGGAGTLVKSGPDQVGFASKDIGGGVGNFTLNSFAKLRVEQGGFRLRSGTVNAVTGVIDERLFGAVPLAELADAITLDGGGIGSNANITLSALRGITISNSPGNNLGVIAGDATLGGGYFDTGATQGMTIPGPISGSGSLYIGDPTTTAANVPTFTLSHANNVNTFSGNLIGVKGGLQLNSSLKVNGLKDVAGFTQNTTNIATITIASGKTLTVGVSGGGGTWSPAIGGAGAFTKMGAGTETLTAINTYGGNTAVQGGTLSITNAYLADAADVLLSTGSIFNLNFAATDLIHSLFINNVLQSAGTWGAIGSGAVHTSALITGTGLLNATVGASACAPGDLNCDGHVDAQDYAFWRKTAGPAGDYTAWRANYGVPPGAGSGGGLSGGSVPEPTSIVLLLSSLGFIAAGRRRTR